MVTFLSMDRLQLITKEEKEDYCRGKNTQAEDSLNNELESFFQDLRLGNRPNKEVRTYFLPELTESELELVEIKDPNYMETFYDEIYRDGADVDEDEMFESKSKSKFVECFCDRLTFTLANECI